MSEIISTGGQLVSPEGDVISSAEDTDVKMTLQQWEEVKDKIRRCDLYRIALSTIAKGRGKKLLKVPIKAMRETEAKQYGLIFNDDGKDMIFIAVDPPGGENSIN
jgi:hypothetical protein